MIISYTNEIYLVWFLPITLIAYQICPEKHRGKILILASYAFFFIISRMLIVYIFAISLLTHYAGILIENGRLNDKWKKGKTILSVMIILLLGILLFLKYSNFIGTNFDNLINGIAHKTLVSFRPLSLVLPIGISFYTLEAVGYLLDVYWGRIEAEKKLENTMLFLCFFPKLMEGPIERYQDASKTLFLHEGIHLQNIETGGVRIFWGMLKKIVVADRLNTVVNTLYANYESYYGVVIMLCGVFYATQLYFEFSGVMDIVIGSAKLFGIELTENFRQPFFAKNASEFWQRWHITLGVWFKNYIFYPMSTSKLVKNWNKYARKKYGKGVTRAVTSALCLFPVWLANGVWHGARWSYIFYGMYYFVLILVETITEKPWKKLMERHHINMHAPWYRAGQFIKLLIIVFTGEMFFRADGLKAGLHMFRSIFAGTGFELLKNDFFLNLGIDKYDWGAVIVGIILVTVVDILIEKNIFSFEKVKDFKLPVKWSVYYALIFSVIIFGAYGQGYRAVDLIYAGF